MRVRLAVPWAVRAEGTGQKFPFPRPLSFLPTLALAFWVRIALGKISYPAFIAGPFSLKKVRALSNNSDKEYFGFGI
jgi:hypothetical protein